VGPTYFPVSKGSFFNPQRSRARSHDGVPEDNFIVEQDLVSGTVNNNENSHKY